MKTVCIGPSRRAGRALVLGLVALSSLAACSSEGDSETVTSDVPATDGPLQQGGTIVIGAEQEPDCIDWIATCAGSIWGSYMMQ
ncbi:MAG: hypothetical protein ACOYL9_16045, partial [Ilumatobacteraceae bacterium]